ncbi:11816_t:CDS:1, partial [Rhizophagus irregularis]
MNSQDNNSDAVYDTTGFTNNNYNNLPQATTTTANINCDYSCSCNSGFSGMNDNNNMFSGTSIPSDHNNYHQHINTSSNSLPNNNNNQQPIFNDASNDNANTQNYQRQSMPGNISTPQFNLQYDNPQSNVYQQQSMPGNGSTPKFNNPNPPQSNV